MIVRKMFANCIPKIIALIKAIADNQNFKTFSSPFIFTDVRLEGFMGR